MDLTGLTLRKQKMARVFCLSLAMAGMVGGLSSAAWADCTNPTATAGTQVYNATHDAMQYCNGINWISMDGSYTAGDGAALDNMGNHTAEKNINMAGFAVTNLPLPTVGTNPATKAYVDSLTGANETDPKVGATNAGKWCKGDGTAVQCTFAAPTVPPPTTFFAVDEQADGVNATAAVANAWTVRELNTVKYNNIAGASLASNQITLPAGKFFFNAVLPIRRADRYKTRLVNVADGTVLAYGTNGWNSSVPAGANGVGYSYLRGVLGFIVPTTVRMEYNMTIANTDSLGIAVPGFGPEIYASVQITQIGAAEALGPPTLSCDAGGTFINGACWYLGALNETCDTVCTSHTSYNTTTQYYGGSSGTNAECQLLMDTMGVPGTGAPATIAQSWGCHYHSTNGRYRGTSATSSSTRNASVQRICACNK
jgi:hypothetical protein